MSAPVRMFGKRISPEALADIFGGTQLWLSIAVIVGAIVVAVLVGRLLRRALRDAALAQRANRGVWLATLVGVIMTLSWLWRPKQQSLHLVLVALAVAVARAVQVVSRSVFGWGLRSAAGDRPALGDLIAVGETRGQLVAQRLLSSDIVECSSVDPGEKTGAIITLPNGLFVTRVLTRIPSTVGCVVTITVPGNAAAHARSRLARAVELELGTDGAHVELNSTSKDTQTVTATLPVAPGEVRAARDRVLSRYLELRPIA